MTTSTLFADDQLEPNLTVKSKKQHQPDIEKMMHKAWVKLTPFWPIKEFVAVNPLQGFLDKPIEEALREAAVFFQLENMPTPMRAINRETIKWCQAFFDEGQATISMPNRELGLYNCWKKLAVWDTKLHGGDQSKIEMLKTLPEDPEKAILKFLSVLEIPKEDQELFLTLALTTLPGWAAHVKYRNERQHKDHPFEYTAGQSEYLAMRLVIIGTLWPEAVDLVHWYQAGVAQVNKKSESLHLIKTSEENYHLPLLHELSLNITDVFSRTQTPKAQLVFCIDTRSDPIRKEIESLGNYETFGYAGFFGLPVALKEPISQETRPSCPVIIEHKHVVQLQHHPKEESRQKQYLKPNTTKLIKNVFHRLKDNFTTSLALPELLGGPAGIWMFIKNCLPKQSSRIKGRVALSSQSEHSLSIKDMSIPFDDQCSYAETVLKTMGLTQTFSPLVIFCGHGSTTENNAFASSLDCGACGGRSGSINAKIICQILNCSNVRSYLKSRGISISADTLFVAGEHNTTTNEICLFNPPNISKERQEEIKALKKQLDLSRDVCNAKRIGLKKSTTSGSKATKKALFKSSDWAQTRPEWGLANNAAFIVGPRSLTKNIDLQGRTFLQSYDWRRDSDGSLLDSILKGPMTVAHWINSQYLFSSIDNVAYGSGSKVTKNITGKVGIMQGNGSDLMHGLPLQSVYESDKTPFHNPCRLMTVIFAPLNKVDKIIRSEPAAKQLIQNGWIRFFCLDSLELTTYELNRELDWQLFE